jgi:hypothetical protein
MHKGALISLTMFAAKCSAPKRCASQFVAAKMVRACDLSPSAPKLSWIALVDTCPGNPNHHGLDASRINRVQTAASMIAGRSEGYKQGQSARKPVPAIRSGKIVTQRQLNWPCLSGSSPVRVSPRPGGHRSTMMHTARVGRPPSNRAKQACAFVRCGSGRRLRS